MSPPWAGLSKSQPLSLTEALEAPAAEAHAFQGKRSFKTSQETKGNVIYVTF